MKNMKKLLALALVIMSIFAIAAPALADMYMYVKVAAGEYVRVRDWPDGNEVLRLHRGDRVTFVSTYGPDWDKIKVPGYTQDLYIMSKFLVENPPSPAWQDQYGVPSLKYAPNTYNSYVVNLQKDLYSAGYTSVTKADGYFGSITKTAVENFQRNNKLTVDGIVGDKTKEALWNKLHP